MYLLNDTPVFLEFFKRILKFSGLQFRNRYIHKQMFLYSQCRCGQKDCATVVLKSKRPWKESIQDEVYFLNTNKGMIILHILENGFMEIEAICYEKYPYKKEIDKYLKNKMFIHDFIPRQRKNLKKLTKKDKQMLHKYFWNLKREKLNTVVID